MNERRGFLKNMGAAAVAAGTAVVATSSRAAEPVVKWRLGSSFPKTLDTIYGGAEEIASKVAELTGGRFLIEVHAGGVLSKPLETLDAVQKGEFECTHTVPYYFYGKDPTIAMDCAIPFGMNSRMLTAWQYEGNGRKLFKEYYAEKWNIVAFAAGNTGTQMGGWYKNEIKTLSDVKGLKMRIGGFGGAVLSRIGGVPTQIPGSEILGALENGKIDACEWVGPYDDEKLGFQKVAPFYYYPGWWEGSAQVALYSNKKAYDALSPEFQSALEAACTWAHVRMQAKYDARNGDALRRLIKGGTKMRAMPQPILDAAFKSAQSIYAELMITNPAWKKIYPDYARFQRDSVAWFRYAENTYDGFMSRVLTQ